MNKEYNPFIHFAYILLDYISQQAVLIKQLQEELKNGKESKAPDKP